MRGHDGRRAILQPARRADADRVAHDEPEIEACACAKLHLVSDSGLRRVGWDETHELIPRSRGSVRAVGIRHVDFARDGKARHTLRERCRWRSPRKQVRRRGVRSADEARRLA